MIVDGSALFAYLFKEPEWESFEAALFEAPSCAMSAVTFLKASMVLWARKQEGGLEDLDAFVGKVGIAIIPVDHAQALAAREAFVRFRKGQHSARLNMGGCFSYALARITGRPLLFKGDDFSRTEIAAAV
ncbi:type II toxin-antitoxin system VapC family toxin [Caenispirillum salinarum]|uniref:type II toxin-antitoxin system VapC family toxin n=1 Tax=Caenispirillum salinarum TaxID=859058 RepID=UPI0038503FAC